MCAHRQLSAKAACGSATVLTFERAVAVVVQEDGFGSTPVHTDTPSMTEQLLQQTYAELREPDDTEVSNMQTVADVANWARINGDFLWGPSPLGSLLRLIADEDDIMDLEIDDVAEVKPANFEKHLDSWRYSQTSPPSGGPLGDCSHIDLDCTPKDVDLSRARTFFNAARIHAGIIYPRARKNQIQHRTASGDRGGTAPRPNGPHEEC